MRVTITERQMRIIAGIVDLFNSNAEQIDYDSLPFDDDENEYVSREEVAEIHRLFWESDDCIGSIDEIHVGDDSADASDKLLATPAPQGWDSVGTDHEDSLDAAIDFYCHFCNRRWHAEPGKSRCPDCKKEFSPEVSL